MPDLLELTRKLTAARSVSGCEGAISDVIRAIAEPYADEMTNDAMGNLIVRKKGTGKKIMFSAHMDSIGMIATHIDENGFIRFASIGGLSPAGILYAPVVFCNGTRGVVARDGKTDPKEPKMDTYYIDIGAKNREQALGHVTVGDTAVYCGETFLAGDMIVSPYLDDRIGCAVLLMALMQIKKTENDLYFVFSSQEEVGLRGAKTAAYAIDPDYGVAVDVTGTGDTPEVSPKMDCKLGGGAAIKIMDASVLCHPKTVGLLEQAAKANAIPVQKEILLYGGTDTGPMMVTRAGVFAGAVSIPTRYIHSPCETASMEDIGACARLIGAFAQMKLD